MPAVLPSRRTLLAAVVLPRIDAAAVVFVGWLFALAAAGTFVLSFGPVLPKQDEWEYIPLLYHAGWGEKLRWLFDRHSGHLYPVGRLVWLLLDAVSGHNFKAGMAASVGILALAAWQLADAAAKLRGRRAVEDVLFAALLLHAGHAENLTMGYQVCFTLLTLTAAGVLRTAANGATRTTGILAGLLVPAVAVNGGLGCLLALAVGPWAIYTTFRCARWAVLPAAAGLGYAVWALAGQPPGMGGDIPPSSDFLGRVTEFLMLGGGGLCPYHSPAGAAVILSTQLVAAGGLAWVCWKQPAERIVAGGLLAVLVGVWLTAVAGAAARPSGWASRYTAVACLGPVVVLLSAARYIRFPGPARRVVGLVGIVLALSLILTSWPAGKAFTDAYRVRHLWLLADLKKDIPIDLLAERRAVFPDRFGRPHFVALWAAGHPLLKGVPPAPDWQSSPLAVSGTIPKWMPHHGPAPTLDVAAPAGPVTAVRLTCRCEQDTYWTELALEWTRPDGMTGEDRLIPWLVRGDQPLTFWVNDTATAFRLRPIGPTDGFRVVSSEALTR